ncbi:MAG: hypothetical protein GX197_01870 [Firmicutes bacterium]|nr:hypothetical protein [Bacillota bacterium]
MQQKTKAFFYGWAPVIIAVIVALITGNKRHFRIICEWVFFVCLVVAVVIFLSKPKPKTKTKSKRMSRYDRSIDTALEIFQASLPSAKGVEQKKSTEPQKPPAKVKHDKAKNPRPDPWKLRRENIEPALTAFLFGLPSLIAELVEYYLF